MNAQPVVYLVDDDPGVLRAVRHLLQAEAMTVRAFGTAEEFLLAHDPLAPGCAVLDMCMPRLSGLAVQQALLAGDSERFIVFMTGRGDVAASVQAMKAGAVDFLVKPFDDDDLLAAVQHALALDEHARKVRLELESIRWRLATLTPREYQVLQHVVVGRLNKQIAADLGIAEKTIKVHRARAMEKMGVGTLAELVRKTVEVEVGALAEDGLDGQPAARAEQRRGAVSAPLPAPDDAGAHKLDMLDESRSCQQLNEPGIHDKR
jgi:FixJ family two-component response regulator